MTRYFLGIQWSDRQLKLACLKKVGDVYRLEKLDQLTIPRREPEKTSQLLALWAKENLPPKSQVMAVLTLPESSIFFKEIELPQAKKEELNEAISWEIPSITPLTSDEAVFDWLKISQTEKTLRLATIVVKNETVRFLPAIIKKAGWQLLAIEPASLALSRLFSLKLVKPMLLIMAEKEETNFVVLKSGAPVFSNSVPIALVGMKNKKRKLSQAVASDLAVNAKKVVSFYQSKEKEKIKEIIVMGEVGRYYGLARTINDLLHVPVVLARIPALPQLEISNQPKAVVERFLVALGAAARPIFETKFPTVNLLPKKERKFLEKKATQKATLKKIKIFSQMTLLFLLINLLTLTGLWFWHRSLVKKVNQTNLFVKNHPAQTLISQTQSLNKLLSQIDELMKNQKDSGEHLRQIALLTPIDIRFDTLTFTGLKKEEWGLEGVGDREDILAFYEKIKTIAGIKQVTMPYSSLEKEKEVNFKIIIKW